MTFIGNSERLQFCSFEPDLLKNGKPDYSCLVGSTKIENAPIPYKTANVKAIVATRISNVTHKN